MAGDAFEAALRTRPSGGARSGITGMGFYLPEERLLLSDLAEQSGTPMRVAEYAGADSVRRAAADVFPLDMAVAAGREALERAQVRAEDLGLVLWCGAAVPEYLMPTTAGAALAALGAGGAHGFDVAQGCAAMLTGLWAASSFLAFDPSLQHVLLLGADRWSSFTPHQVCDSVFFGDGGGAVVVSRGEQPLRLLAYQGITRGEFSDLWRLDGGGIRARAAREQHAGTEGRVAGPRAEGPGGTGADHYRVVDPERAHGEFKEIYVPVILDSIRGALRRAALEPDDIDFVSMVNANLRVLQVVLGELGIPEERSSADYLRRFGHFGAPDVFFNLFLALEQGRVRPGDRVLLVSTGIGFHWVAAVVEC